MLSTVFKCDECERAFTNQKHISLAVSNQKCISGIAMPPDEEAKRMILLGQVKTNLDGSNPRVKWEVVKHEDLTNKLLHFCNGQCIGQFFSKLLKKAV